MQLWLMSVLLVSPCLANPAAFAFPSIRNAANATLRFISRLGHKDGGIQKTTGSSSQSYPDFCNGLVCPKFTVLEDKENYQLRQYEETNWVSTTMTGISYDDAQSDMFYRLFDYISGKNAKKMKIAMTAPVIERVMPGQGPACVNNFTMSFFIDPSLTDLPQPSDANVTLTTLPALKAYVHSFGGRAHEKEYLAAAAKLTQSLPSSAKFATDFFYTGGYDSPFKLFNRHNEVWFIAM